MHKGFLKTAALLAACSIALGAFGAHSLKEAGVAQETLSVFETGIRYQFYHLFALLITAMLYKEFPNRATIWAARLFIAGIILFSGSLYFLTWAKFRGLTQFDPFGMITPVGGLAFICGWISLFLAFTKRNT